jgi:phosphate transport system substrate-binding protein
MLRRSLLLLALIALVSRAFAQDTPSPETDASVVATASTKAIMTSAARTLRDTRDLQVAVSGVLTSQDALLALASGSAGIALITRPISGDDRAAYPESNFVSIPIGMQVVAIAVSEDLWSAGIHTIRRESIRAIYEQKITNWKQLGGPDQKITFFNFPQGQGIWEIFAQWIYSDNRKAPIPKFEKVTSSEDARDSLEFNPGSIAILGAGAVDSARCHALAIVSGTSTVSPTPVDVASGAYPVVRPILAVVIGSPTLGVHAVTDFLTSPAGQAIVKKTGALGLEAVKPTPTPSY